MSIPKKRIRECVGFSFHLRDRESDDSKLHGGGGGGKKDKKKKREKVSFGMDGEEPGE
jgi:hypothetical protein